MSSGLPLVHVVDDDPSVGRSLGRLLRSLGLRARTFASGKELLGDARRSEAACFVVDVHMPEMNGYELAKRLGEVAPESPVIFITARVEETDRWQEQPAAAVALLLKPFSESELVAALRKALGQDNFPNAQV